jgi:hypothetical protein
MDDDARRSARTRAAIAFGLAGVLLVINLVAAAAWREERRDRFDGARAAIERRVGEGREDGPQPWGGPGLDEREGPGQRQDGAGPRPGQAPQRDDDPDGGGASSDADRSDEQEGSA